MKPRSVICLIASAIMIAAPSIGSSQICRVSAGCNANGGKSYKEVYEYDYVEEKPAFPGGGTAMINFINEKRQYPKEAYNKGIEGRVTCAFVVNTDGSISNLSVMKGVEESLNNEAIRILSKMPAWTPGKMGGQPVPVRVICCVPFRK